tara:strand:- start:15 stop:1484 length:1470 start_codon:yes stop_codon:yes gene_type:complete
MTLTQITEKGIKDGEIINADINASAAIAGTKVTPNFGSQAISTTGAITLGNGSGLNFNNTSARIIGESGSSGLLRFDVNGGERVRINHDGRMMVNGTYGAAQFNVTGESALGLDAKRQFLGINSDNDDMNIRATYYTGGAAGGAYPDIKFTTSDAERLRITADGKVGINTSSPATGSELDVNGKIKVGAIGIGTVPIDHQHIHIESANPRILVRSTGTNSAKLMFGDQSNNDAGVVEYAHSSNTMSFATGTVERMRIDSAGKVKIGTTNGSPHANADELTLGDPSGTQRSGMTINSGANKDGSIHFGDPDSNLSGQINYDHNLDCLRFYTANDKRVRIDSDGLKFGNDSAAANALDDYEEGTWTPAITASAGNSAPTNIYHASYTKVGNQVFISCYIGAGANNSTGGLWTITGLPFTSKSNNHYFSISVGYWNSLQGNINHLTGTVQPNDTSILMRGTSGANSATSNLAYATYVGNGTEFLLSATYLVP